MLIFGRGEKPEYPEKKFAEEKKINNNLANAGTRTQITLAGDERSLAHCTTVI